jgi:PEP-CTERM motif-containing protein
MARFIGSRQDPNFTSFFQWIAKILRVAVPVMAALVVAARADVMTIQPEKVGLPLPDPRLGVDCIAVPGSTCWIAWEDLFGRGDGDFNDAVFTLSISEALEVSFNKIWSVTSYTDFMTVEPPVLGQPLLLALHVHEPVGVDRIYVAGSGGGNADGLAHALVVQELPVLSFTETPEPAAMLLAGVGLAAIWWMKRRAATQACATQKVRGR